MKKSIIYLILSVGLFSCHSSRKVVSTNSIRHEDRLVAEYTSLYAGDAVAEMSRTGIPASITLAQGMIESDFGRSMLATEANNHFGIKCHKNWSGRKIYHDDDRRHECFRKYSSVDDSFRDHSDFLSNGARYDFLFDLRPGDYKEWAKGLKKAGYATNPKYAGMLINMIEENNLYLYDRAEPGKRAVRNERTGSTRETSVASGPGYVQLRKSRISERNRIQYIVVNERDTYRSIIEEFDLLSWELFKYNNIDDGEELVVGQVLYLQPKRNKAEVGNDYHIVKEGETMESISQLYGIKLKSLYEKNHLTTGRQPATGTELWLRRVKPEGL